MKNKGFTLIELLAVIVVLALIALFTIPNIMKTINTSKNDAFNIMIQDVYSQAEKEYVLANINEENEINFCSSDFEGETLENCIAFSYGNVNGKYYVALDSEGKVSKIGVSNESYCYYSTTPSIDFDTSDVEKDKVLSCNSVTGCSCVDPNTNANSNEPQIDSNIITDNVNSMKNNSSVSNGQVVKTKGFYAANDGGGSYYNITNGNLTVDNITVFSVKNGLKAKLIISDNMNLKQFGAKGDGTTDDHVAFDTAITSGTKTLYIPKGTYNINSNTITTNSYVKLVGNNKSNTIIKNGTIVSQYGINVESITFDGGAPQRIDYVATHANDEDGTIALMVTPNGARDVIYKDCAFKNVTVASFARDENDIPEGSRLTNNTIENCTFDNIRKVAVYHSLNLDNGKYNNNTFTNIGGNDISKGFVGALFIGDITNSTEKEAKSIIIKGNTFNNLVTKDDFSGTQHVINANFIAIKSDKAVISNNTVSSLIGYGEDREGIYTKVRDLTITNNRLTNAGLGEGYVCAKPHAGIAFFNINNNTFNGEAGCAIRSYAPGMISGNTINITNTKNAITNSISGVVTVGDKTLTIKGNTFTSGTQATLTVNGTTIESYSSNILIRLSNVHVPSIIEDNIITPTTAFNQYIAVGNPGETVIVRNNKFNVSDKSGMGIFVFNASGNTNSLNNTTIIEGNYFNGGNNSRVARTALTQPDGTTTHRTISFLNNEIIYNGSNYIYVLSAESGPDNEDKLIVSGNTCNKSKSKTIIKSQLKDFEIDNEEFAKVTLTYGT